MGQLALGFAGSAAYGVLPWLLKAAGNRSWSPSPPTTRSRAAGSSTLARERFVVFPRRRGAVLHDAVINTCQHAGFSPRVVQEATELPTQVSLVSAGMGVALVPASMRHLRYSGVVYRSLHGLPPAPDTAVAWRREEETPTVKAFLRVVRAVADRSDGDDLDLIGPAGIESAPVAWRNSVSGA